MGEGGRAPWHLDQGARVVGEESWQELGATTEAKRNSVVGPLGSMGRRIVEMGSRKEEGVRRNVSLGGSGVVLRWA